MESVFETLVFSVSCSVSLFALYFGAFGSEPFLGSLLAVLAGHRAFFPDLAARVLGTNGDAFLLVVALLYSYHGDFVKVAPRVTAFFAALFGLSGQAKLVSDLALALVLVWTIQELSAHYRIRGNAFDLFSNIYEARVSGKYPELSENERRDVLRKVWRAIGQKDVEKFTKEAMDTERTVQRARALTDVCLAMLALIVLKHSFSLAILEKIMDLFLLLTYARICIEIF